MKKLIAPFSLLLAFLGVVFAGFLTSANAAGTMAPEEGSLLELARPIFDAVMQGHYIASAALALVFVVALVKRYAPAKFSPYVHSDAGGALTTLLMAFGGALATATVGGAPWTWAMMWTALGVGLAAMGGYTAIKRLFVVPLLRPLRDKLPVWARPVLDMVLWMFDKPVEATAKATAAGVVAVAEKPAAGVDAVTGEAKDL
jgi:hypothetical protein